MTTLSVKASTKFSGVSKDLTAASNGEGLFTLKHKQGDVTASLEFTDKTAQDLAALQARRGAARPPPPPAAACHGHARADARHARAAPSAARWGRRPRHAFRSPPAERLRAPAAARAARRRRGAGRSAPAARVRGPRPELPGGPRARRPAAAAAASS